MNAISTPLDEVLFSAAMANVRGVSAARAALAQLRADLQAAQEAEQYWQQTAEQELHNAAEQRDRAEELRARVADQARQLDAARKVIERCAAYIGSIDYGENTRSYEMCDAWLAANPAPSVEACAACGTPLSAPEHDPTCPVFSYASAQERPVSDVELEAYRYYLGESDNRLCGLFDDMLVDELERYCKANAPEKQP